MKLRVFFISIIFLLFTNIIYALTIIEDAEDGTTDGWRVRIGTDDAIGNIYDAQSDSRVIQFNGGGSHIFGGTHGESALNIRGETAISWRMRVSVPYTLFVIIESREGLRYLFYTFSPNRGLLHGFEGGIMHGLGPLSIDGRWRTFTRDLERDLKDAEPDNEIIAINGFMYNGGDGGVIDDIVLYSPNETIYEDGERGISRWHISDNDPLGATIRNIPDNDRQGRTLQGNVIQLEGNGVLNAYRIGAIEGENAWNNRTQRIVQWRFRDFGDEPEVLSVNPDERGFIRDRDAFQFRVHVDTREGHRDLLYTLGDRHQGIIENGTTIHHALGDDRIRGSIWAGDNPMNEIGLWQTITRDISEDIRDFEPNNELIAVNGFEVRNSGLVDDIKMLSYPFDNDGETEKEKSQSVVGTDWFSLLIYFGALMLFFFFDKNIQRNVRNNMTLG